MRIAKLSLLVRDYDEAIDWYTRSLGFGLAEDVDMGNGKRWVVIEPTGTRGAALLLAKAANPQQEAAIGNQSGGRVFLFLETDSFDRDHARMVSEGVNFREAPRSEAYGKVAVFEDLYGNAWDLIGPA
jgi:catechol 2,3-dioxygenase-like lactoylglutathione lyase family enzyme